MTGFDNFDIQNSLPNKTQKYLFPKISRELTPYLQTKPLNTCKQKQEAEAKAVPFNCLVA